MGVIKKSSVNESLLSQIWESATERLALPESWAPSVSRTSSRSRRASRKGV
jgi:hypothetical protein